MRIQRFNLGYWRWVILLSLISFCSEEKLVAESANKTTTWLAESQKLRSGEKEELPALKEVCHRLLRHPSAAFSENGKWRIFVENVTAASIQEAESFDSALKEAQAWMAEIRHGALGNRSERASLELRVWKRFLMVWSDKAPEEVRTQLNAAKSRNWDAVSRDERESWSFAEAALRTKFLEQARKAKTETAALERELTSCLKDPGVPVVSRIANSVHYARSVSAEGAPDRALALLGELRKQELGPEELARVLNATFFICWFGKGDRPTAWQTLLITDDLLAKGKLPESSPELASLHAAYYRGLLLTSDQLRTLHP